MEENENKETNVKATIDAVTGLVTAIPIYQDTIQPSAKQIGKSLETVTKTVNIALAPIKALVWGYEKIEDFISKRVSEKLKNVAEENIVTPPASIAGPAIEALRFSGEDVNLRDLYANLIASSMDLSTQDLVHPGYVEILKNLSSDEALLLKVFINFLKYPLIDIMGEIEENSAITHYEHFSHLSKITNLKRPDMIPTYLDNLCRLGITIIPTGKYINIPNIYEPLENDKSLEKIKEEIRIKSQQIYFEHKVIQLTNFGKLFIKNVVIDK